VLRSLQQPYLSHFRAAGRTRESSCVVLQDVRARYGYKKKEFLMDRWKEDFDMVKLGLTKEVNSAASTQQQAWPSVPSQAIPVLGQSALSCCMLLSSEAGLPCASPGHAAVRHAGSRGPDWCAGWCTCAAPVHLRKLWRLLRRHFPRAWLVCIAPWRTIGTLTGARSSTASTAAGR
jgi:hypothetical protein